MAGGRASHAENETSAAGWDVVVVGGGNAALCAALSARRIVPRVLLVERSPRHMRGGNTRHTRNVRCAHAEPDAYNTGSYTVEELWTDLCSVGSGPNKEELARFTVEQSEELPAWMGAHGIHWQQPLAGTLQLGRTNRFFLGGGKALVNSYYQQAEREGVAVVYDTAVEGFLLEQRRCARLRTRSGTTEAEVVARTVVCASGGFEANLDWLERYWGPGAQNYVVRGTPYNDGTVLQALFDLGAASAGEERGFHAIALDARAPRFDGGIATRVDCIPFGIVVNGRGERFDDEGEDLWPKRYAIWGSKLALQDEQVAYGIWDAKAAPLFLPPMYPPARAGDVPTLALELGLDPEALWKTVASFNAAIEPGGSFDPGRLDDCRTFGLEPPKSHWARPLDTPPFYGLAMRPGVTFTYRGVSVDRSARVLDEAGEPFDNIFAAGEIMSGNILSTGYLAGFGMTIGSVWGRLAGENAAMKARELVDS